MPSKRKRGGGRQVVEVDGSGTETDDRRMMKARRRKGKPNRRRRSRSGSAGGQIPTMTRRMMRMKEDEEDEEEDPRVNKRMKTGSTGKQKGKTGKVQSVRWCTTVSLLPCFGRTPFFDIPSVPHFGQWHGLPQRRVTHRFDGSCPRRMPDRSRADRRFGARPCPTRHSPRCTTRRAK